MAGARQGVPDLRIGVPTLEPDPAFIAQLAALAAAAAVPVVIRPRQHLKVALAAASVAAIATGGAWASGALSGNDTPAPPSRPVDHPSVPVTTPSEPTGEDAASRDGEPKDSSPGTDVRTTQPGEQPGGYPGDEAPEYGAGPANVPLPTDTDDEDEPGDEPGEQREPDEDDDSDGHGSGDSDEDEDHHGPGGGDADDPDPDDETAGDDGSRGPDPSDADD